MDNGLLDRIRQICHELEHSLFTTKEQREKLKEELAKLQGQLDNLRKVLNETTGNRSTE